MSETWRWTFYFLWNWVLKTNVLIVFRKEMNIISIVLNFFFFSIKHCIDIFNWFIYFDLTSYKIFLKHICPCLNFAPMGISVYTIWAECILIDLSFSHSHIYHVLSCILLTIGWRPLQSDKLQIIRGLISVLSKPKNPPLIKITGSQADDLVISRGIPDTRSYIYSEIIFNLNTSFSRLLWKVFNTDKLWLFSYDSHLIFIIYTVHTGVIFTTLYALLHTNKYVYRV